jgi:ATP-dependent exoDNAse (exonuclease V) alpha subunit
LILDEAALLETNRWHQLLRARGDAGIVAAGDDHQLSSIEAGGVWSVLDRRIGSARLEHNYRAREEWARDAWMELRRGAAPQALAEFERRGQIELHDIRVDSRMAAVERWDRERQGHPVEQHLLLTDASNHEVDHLNRLAQARRAAYEELGTEFVAVDARDARTGHERHEELHVGDRVQFERRVKPERGRQIENGATGTVVGIDPDQNTCTVEVGARAVTLRSRELDALRLGYAQHIYSAQGRTVENAYVVLGGWQTDRERSYVGVSRARGRSVIFSDYDSLGVEMGKREEALALLAERCSISRRKVAALTLAERREIEVSAGRTYELDVALEPNALARVPRM